jgi:hypothetical protein
MANNIVVTHADDLIPEVIANEGINLLQSNLRLGRLVRRDVDATPARAGRIISIPKYGDLSVNDKTENSDTTRQQPSTTEVQITLNKHKEVTFGVEDYLRAVKVGNLEDSYMGQGMIRLAEQIESDIAALFTAGFTTHAAIDASSGLTEDNVLTVRKNLTDSRAPNSNRFMVVDTGSYNDLLKIDRFSRNDAQGEQSVINTGMLGTIHGFQALESIHLTSAGSPTTYDCAGFHRDAIALVTRPFQPSMVRSAQIGQVTDEQTGLSMRVEIYRDPDAKADVISIDVLYGVQVIRPELGQEINTQ